MSLFCLYLIIAVGFFIYWNQLHLVFFFNKTTFYDLVSKEIVLWVPVNLENLFSGKEGLRNTFLLSFQIQDFYIF